MLSESESTFRTCQLVTDGLQIQERLISHLRQHMTTYSIDNEHWKPSQKVIDECKEMRDKLREVKSVAEGSAIKFEPVSFDETTDVKTAVQKIRQMVLQLGISRSFSSDQKQILVDSLHVIFGNYWKRLMFAGILRCPWYASTQPECGQQAKHNRLLIVFVAQDSQFFAPLNRNMKRKDGDIIEHEDWLHAVEVFHFAHYAAKGNVRFIESLFLPESCVLYSDEQWLNLVKFSTDLGIFGMSGFLEQCRGQAVGNVARKLKKNGMVMRDTATLLEFCDSFRLLQHAGCVLTGLGVSVESVTDMLPLATEALSILKIAYHPETAQDCKSTNCKQSLFKLLMQWRNEVDSQFARYTFTNASRVKMALEEWLREVRLHRTQVESSRLTTVEDSKRSTLMSLMSRIGGPVSKMSPEQIILIARAGSHLYDLSKVDSDTDYVVVYAEPLEIVVSTVNHLSESHESKGLKLPVEYGAYEVRFVAEMLWKGSVVMLELVFADDLDYCSEAWMLLTSNRKLFVTEQAVLQYLGLIRNNMTAIQSNKHKGTARDLKLFYQIFHKLYCLEFFVRGQYPKIKCQGETRDFIMGIRKANPEDVDRDRLFQQVCEQYNSLKQVLNERCERLPEYVNYQFLLNWLMSVRGLC